MSRHHLIFGPIFAAFIIATGCGVGDRTFPPVGAITTIKIVGRDNRELVPPISDQRSVGKIIAFVDAERRGWNMPIDGIPVPRIIAEFYYGDTFKGHFGAGKGFFETQRAGGFYSKKADPNHVQEFLQLLGVPTEQLNR